MQILQKRDYKTLENHPWMVKTTLQHPFCPLQFWGWQWQPADRQKVVRGNLRSSVKTCCRDQFRCASLPRRKENAIARAESLLDKGIVPTGFLQRAKQANTLHTAIREYIEKVSIKREDVELLGLWIKECPANLSLLSIDFHWCVQQLARLKQERNLAPGTIRKRIGALSRCLTWHVALGHLLANPLSSLQKGYAQYTQTDKTLLTATGRAVKTDTRRDRRMNSVEESRILALLDAKVSNAKTSESALDWIAARTLFLIAIETAMRLSEMVGLTHRQVDIAKRTVFLHKTKNGTPRQVPMSQAALKAMMSYVEQHVRVRGRVIPSAYFFPWIERYNGEENALDLASAAISRRLIMIFRAAGADDLLFHDLRHEATSRLHENSRLSVTEIMTITGHKTHAMMLRYTHLRGSSLVDKM